MFAGYETAYTIVVSNEGPDDVVGARVLATLPASLLDAAWICVPSEGAVCPASGQGSINRLVDLDVGSSATFEVTATVDAAFNGTLSVTATVVPPGGLPDPDGANNTATDSSEATPATDLSIRKTGLIDDGASYTLVVTNAGPIEVVDAAVDDVLPEGLLECSWTCLADGEASCTVGPTAGDVVDLIDLPVDSSVTYEIVCTVDDEATEIVNTATVTPPDGITDPELEDNSDSAALDFSLIFEDGFESDDLSAWSDSVGAALVSEVEERELWSLVPLLENKALHAGLSSEPRSVLRLSGWLGAVEEAGGRAGHDLLIELEARRVDGALELRVSGAVGGGPADWVPIELPSAGLPEAELYESQLEASFEADGSGGRLTVVGTGVERSWNFSGAVRSAAWSYLNGRLPIRRQPPTDHGTGEER